MYGIYYVGIVLEVSVDRIKVLRRTKIYQFSCKIPTNIVPGSWINFAFSDDSMVPIIEACSPILPTRIIKLNGTSDLASCQISIQTVAAIPCRSNIDNNFEQYVWSPHFEWILDDDGIFSHENVMPDIVYVIWIELLNKPFNFNSNVLMKVTEIVRPAHDQLPIYDAPWIESEMPADAELLSVHSLQNRPKDKINPAAVYSGLVIWRDMTCQQKQVVLWSIATGIVYFRHEQCQNIAVGAWIDFAVRIGRGDVLEAHKLKYSKRQIVSTREVKGKAQICQKMKLPENLPEKDWIWVSDIVGKVWIELDQFKRSAADRWDELAGSVTHVWLSFDQFYSTIRWKFDSIVESNECAETEDSENIERFADLVKL
ncbi:unnamed protein product [Cercopithifilaria johnstoni]|uniref:DUF7038 domain-containing protein n=1 Tax=Cercopithifilaria johnstoni TaxID=2874296 RepID=A0A8J2M9U6_9BILA|nr:unnamed protein product [Cercopithifilaria johnstoni]